jgi:hypothetical protein
MSQSTEDGGGLNGGASGVIATREGGLQPVAKGRGRAARGRSQTPQQRQQKSRAAAALRALSSAVTAGMPVASPCRVMWRRPRRLWRMLVVEQEEQEQMKRHAHDAKAACVLRMRSTSPSCASPHGQVEGSGGGRGSGGEDGGDEDADD